MLEIDILECVLKDVGFNPNSTYINKNSIVKSFYRYYNDTLKRSDATTVTIWLDKETNEITSFFVRKSLYSSKLIEIKDFYEENKYTFRKHKLLNLV